MAKALKVNHVAMGAKILEEMKEVIETVTQDWEKFTEKGTNAAGTRVRTGAQTLRGMGKDLREVVTEIREERKG